MIKLLLKTILILLSVVLIAGFVGYTYSFNQLQNQLVGAEDGNSDKPLKYHFSVILQDTGNNFWQSIMNGAKKAGKDYGAAVEFSTTVVRNEDEELQNMSIAIASHVDGIAIYVTDNAKFTPLINKAVSMHIPVVTIESDDKSSKRLCYIGANSYNAGYTAGSMVNEATNGTANAAVIFSGNYPGDADSQNALLRGFRFATTSTPGVKLRSISTQDSGYFGAEKTIRDILTNNPDINTVVCTSSDDTLEVTQVLIDLNKVGRITVIGYNNLPQIRDYIRNDVLYGSVVENPEETGYQSIKSLVRHCQGYPVEGTVDTLVGRMTRSNLLDYTAST